MQNIYLFIYCDKCNTFFLLLIERDLSQNIVYFIVASSSYETYVSKVGKLTSREHIEAQCSDEKWQTKIKLCLVCTIHPLKG